MENTIVNKEDLLKDLLNEEHYFQSMLQVLYSNELLNIQDIESIQVQILNILTETLGYYTRNESSSVRVEVADKIMLSIYYTIGIFLKNNLTIKGSISLIKEKGVKYIFTQGEETLKAKVKKCQKLLDHVQQTKLNTINYAYVDTIEYGIPLFFKEYDIRFGSHVASGSIDYPLAIDEMKLVGIEYIEDYLNKINLENKFCYYFQDLEIDALLKGFNTQSHHLLINIFKLVLTNYLGCTLLGKERRSLEISEDDRVYLRSRMENLSEVDFKKVILIGVQKIVQELSIEDSNLIAYMNETISKVIPEIRDGMEKDALENIFITLNKSEESMVKYEDGESIDNSIFKEITEEIRDCINIEEKIEIIREEFHSLKDLVDVLSADCIFEDEFIEIFKVLDDFEIALLFKHIPKEEFMDSNYGTESEKEWQEKLKEYLNGVDNLRKEEIIRISQGVDI